MFIKFNQFTQSKLALFAALRQVALILFSLCFAGGATFNRAQNPPPTLSSISPNSAQAGSPALTLTATGANFNRLSVVQWNGAALPTNFVTTSQLTATVPASDLATPGTATVRVVDPAGLASNSLPFTITAPPPATPVLSSIFPNTVEAGSPAFVLTATGNNFTAASFLRWNGANRPTTVISPNQLTAQIPASDVASVGAASVTIFTPPNTAGAGGGASNVLPFTITAPAPAPQLVSINPNSANAGNPAFVLTVTGTNFAGTSVVRWNGSNRPTTFLSSTQLMAQIPSADIASAGAASITVATPPSALGLGGGVSNALPFTINVPPPPAPLLIAINPNSAEAGSPAFLLTVTGNNFVSNSVVRWNGAARATTFVSANQLTAQIPASDVANAGTANVTVFTPPNVAGVGGGISNPAPFTITPPPPAPTLISLNPNAANAGGMAFVMTVTGNNFAAGSTVRWNGANRPTIFISANQLSAQIPASDITNPGGASVTVFTPPNAAGLGGGVSNALPFTINVPPPPAPLLIAINPNSTNAGSVSFVLTVTGNNFVNGSTVRWNGTNRATTFASANQLTAQIPASDVANAGTANVTVFTPPNTAGAGGGASSPLPFTITPPPPAPQLISITPNTAAAGGINGGAFTLTVNGSNFINTSVVRWNGVNRPTVFVSANQLNAQIPASDIISVGTASVTVFTPPNLAGIGGGTSNAAPFTVNQAPNPVPTINGLNPNPAMAGGSAFILTVAGTNFVANSVVQVNGANRPTMFVSANQLTAQLPASDIATAGSASVQVANPAPGGGTSGSLQLNIVNPAPTIATAFPNSIVAASPGFTLTVNGTGFVAGSSVRWNGANRQTSFISSTQLSAQIVAGDVLSVGSASVTVANPAPGGGVSNPVTFTVLPQPLPPPVLQNLTSTAVAQGARQVRLTLIGANFRPGARVVIGASPSNPGLMPAADIIIESVSRLNDTTIQALISVSPQASLETRSVDVINSDNSSTSASRSGAGGTNTTKPLRVQGGTSLGAPLQVTSLLITYPRTGTVIAQGDAIFAEAILAGAGTGTVIGQWLWDGNVYEQFVLNLTGGERQPLRTSRALPTVFLGSHTLELKIVSPNIIQSPAITVVVNPGSWKQLRLLAPNSGRGFTPERTPTLRWAIVPGVAKYQVGFSTQPYFRTVTKWHDVSDTQWTVPSQVWSGLPEGEIFWTVRVVEMSGSTRQPALMRRIQRVASGALGPLPAAADTAHNVLLQWQGMSASLAALYRITISRDAEGHSIVRRFLTNASKVDLHSISGQMTAGETYYWHVEAFTGGANGGRFVLAGAPQSFVASAGKKITETQWQLMRDVPAQERVSAARNADPVKRYIDIASLTLPPLPLLGDTDAEDEQALPTQNLDDRIVNRTPASGKAVNDARPLIAAELKDKFAPTDVALLIDDTDVTAVAQIAGSRINHRPAIPFTNGLHQVTLKVGAQTAEWNFNVMAATPATDDSAATPGTEAEAEKPVTAGDASTTADAGTGEAGEVKKQKTLKVETASNTQSVSRQEQDKNDLSMSAQGTYVNGPWKAEMNSTGLINTIFSPAPRHLFGRWSDYVFKLTRDVPQTKWGAEISFGMIAPQLHLNSEYLTTGFAREGVEAALRTPMGKFSFYRNTNDKGQGEGIGFNYHQQVESAGYEMPALKLFGDPERIKFRLTWMSARDVDGTPLRLTLDEHGQPLTATDAFASPRAGDSFGGLLTIKLTPNWLWNSEYALTTNNVNRLLATSPRQYGRAWRTGVAGTWHKANINLAFRDVSPNFAIPATANLSQLSLSDRRGLDFSISRDTKAGNFSGTYQLLQSDFRYSTRAHLVLHNIGLNWSKMITKSTSVTLGTSEARTLTTNQGVPSITGETEQRRFGVNASVNQTINTEKYGAITLGLTGSRNWFRDNVNKNVNNIISSAGINTGWTPKPFFQLQSNFSVNWTAGEKFTAGNAVIKTLYLQPVLTLAKTGWAVMPLISINHMTSHLGTGVRTSNLLMTQTGGRISYQLPGRLRFNTFSFEGSVARTHDGLNRTTMMMPRFLFLWTMVKPAKPAPEPAQASAPQQQQTPQTAQAVHEE